MFTIRSPLLAEVNDLQVVAIATLEPLDALQLGVNKQRPALTVGQYSGILSRYLITWQALVIPLSNGGTIC